MGFRCDRLRVVAFFELFLPRGFYSVSRFRLINDNAGGLRIAISSFCLKILLTLDDGAPAFAKSLSLSSRARAIRARDNQRVLFLSKLNIITLTFITSTLHSPRRIKIQKNSTTSDITAWNPKIPPETRACFHEAKRAGMDCSIVLRTQFVFSSNTQHSST